MSPKHKHFTQLTVTTAEWEHLLAPISEDAPTGESLRYDQTYDQIKEARRYDEPSLPQGDWKTELKKANWEDARYLCIEALTTRSKDLQITAWLMEAWLHLHGYQGLKEGLRLFISLSEKYWDNLYPPIEDGDLDYRLSPLVWLNEKLSTQLGHVPITAPTTNDAELYTFNEREFAWWLDNRSSEEKEAAKAEGKPTRSQFLTSATLTPRAFYVHLAADLQSVIDYTDQLNQLINKHGGEQAPSVGKFRQRLEDIQNLVKATLKDKPGETEDDTETIEDEAAVLSSSRGQRKALIRSRDDAYRSLAEAAEYLMKTEPHSPTPYLVKRAIKWGNLSLTELLMELVNNEHDLAAIYNLLGIKDK